MGTCRLRRRGRLDLYYPPAVETGGVFQVEQRTVRRATAVGVRGSRAEPGQVSAGLRNCLEGLGPSQRTGEDLMLRWRSAQNGREGGDERALWASCCREGRGPAGVWWVHLLSLVRLMLMVQVLKSPFGPVSSADNCAEARWSGPPGPSLLGFGPLRTAGPSPTGFDAGPSGGYTFWNLRGNTLLKKCGGQNFRASGRQVDG